MNILEDDKFKIIKDIIEIALLLIIIILLVLVMFKKKENVVVNQDKKVALLDKNTVPEKDNDNCVKETKKIYVDVKGAVNKQGVYLLEEGDIVEDAIKAAGGLTNKGTTININLSKKIQDQMVIYIYTNTELNKLKKEKQVDTKENVENEICNCPSYDINTCEGSSLVVNEDNAYNSENNNDIKDNKVNINTATKEQLLSLSGIGESKAVAIVDYRNNNGLFKRIEDIKNVSGIGEALFAKIKDFITV